MNAKVKAALEALGGEARPSESRGPAIAEIERALGVPLDPVTRVFLHFVPAEPEGQKTPPAWTDWGSWTVLTLKQMLEERAATLGLAGDEGIDADPGVRAKWFHRGWLPIADNGGGDLLCVDCDPAPGGTAGQIVEFRHEDHDRRRVATHLVEYLQQVLAARSRVKPPEPPRLPTLAAQFFVDGEPAPAKISVFGESTPEPIAEGPSPLKVAVPRGTYSLRFVHEGRSHWRRDVYVWQEERVDFHW